MTVEARRQLLTASAGIDTRIRNYGDDDLEAIVALSLRAWEPVFASLEHALGAELFKRLRGDWRQGQSAAVYQILGGGAARVWIAEAQGQLAGFVAAAPHPESDVRS